MVIPLVGSQSSIVGTVLSHRWRLVRKLGEGGMGQVFAADAVDGGLKTAVKVLRREFVADPDIRARFVEEAHMCMRLLHPNIVRVLECARSEDDAPYIVMELLDGVPLSAYMQNGARIPIAQAAPIVYGILGGLGAAHASGIVHRDLKPDNVILTRDPRGAIVVKLVDFGIAKVMDAAGGMGNRTRTGILLGTPAYMSPEQARSARDVDQRTDLWSVGVLFYEMLSGRVAFPAPTEYARLAALLSTEPEPIDRVDSALAPLVPFLERALRKNRDERFGSATEMARALATALPPGRSDGPPAGWNPTPLPATVMFTAGIAARPAADEAPLEPPMASGINRRHDAAASVPALSLGDPLLLGTSPPYAAPAPKGPAKGGTLASPHANAAMDPVPDVLFVDPRPLGGTLPSELRPGDRTSRPPPASSGVAPKRVVFFVVLALALGLVLGWVMSRLA